MAKIMAVVSSVLKANLNIDELPPLCAQKSEKKRKSSTGTAVYKNNTGVAFSLSCPFPVHFPTYILKKKKKKKTGLILQSHGKFNDILLI